LIFALYCNVPRRYAGGQNGIAFFFALTAIALWVKYAFSDQQIAPFTVINTIELLAAAVSMAGGYALWNVGILRGNLTMLKTVSYFAPVLLSAFAAAWLSVEVTKQFSQGAVFVTIGLLICWAATRTLTLASEQ
jgi:drug/metabolite transporter (DMT)-like permease